MKECVIFIGSNTTGSGVDFLRKCAELGFQPIYLHRPNVAVDIPETRPEIISVSTDIDDYQAIRETVFDKLEQFSIRGVLSSSEYYVAAAARLAGELGFPAPDPAAIQSCRNKKTQRDILQTSGIAQPQYASFRVKNDLKQLFAELKLDNGAIVKPTQGSGSVGVYYLPDADSFDSIEAQMRKDSQSTSLHPQDFLLEEYVEGDEYSVELFNGRSFGVTRKYLTPRPRFLEIGHDFPACSLSYTDTVKLQIAAEEAARALGLSFGPVHVELKKLHNGQIRIIEVNPRLAGGSLPRLFELVGFDAVKAAIQAATGLPVVPWQDTPYRCASIRFLLPPKSGAIKSVQFPMNSNNSETLLYKQVGTKVEKTGDFRERVGHIVVFGTNGDETRRRADSLVKAAFVETD